MAILWFCCLPAQAGAQTAGEAAAQETAQESVTAVQPEAEQMMPAAGDISAQNREAADNSAVPADNHVMQAADPAAVNPAVSADNNVMQAADPAAVNPAVSADNHVMQEAEQGTAESVPGMPADVLSGDGSNAENAAAIDTAADSAVQTPGTRSEIDQNDTVNSGVTAAEEAELLRALAADMEETEEEKASQPVPSSNPIVAAVQSMNPDMAITGDFVLGWFSTDSHLQTGAHDPTKIGFNLQQLEMTLGASVDHIFRMDANLVFSLSGVELEEAYMTTLGLPASLQVRVGQFLSRMGRINPTHPHTWDFVDQVFVIGKMYGAEGNRGLGLEISWLTPLPWYLEIVASALMPTSGASNRSFLNDETDVNGVQDFVYTVALKQFFSLSDTVGLFWGLNAQFGPNNTGYHNRTNILSTDFHLKYSPANYPEMSLVFQAELFFRQRQVPHDVLWDGAGYAQLVWQINKEWATGIRGEYGCGIEDDYLDPEWTDDRGRAALQVTYTPSHFTRLRGQFSVDVPTWRDDPIYALFLALEFTAGTHPAHNY